MKYRYCSVLPVNQHTTYSYIADFDIQVHAFVEIPFGPHDSLTQGVVMAVTECTAKEAPFPVEKTKHITREITKEEFFKHLRSNSTSPSSDRIEEELAEVEIFLAEDDYDGMMQWADQHFDCLDCPPLMEKVLECYERCVEQNNPEAALSLGSMYYNGTFVQRDYKKAAALYEIAAKAGDSQALTNLGYCYFYGRHQEVDYAKAMQYFMLGALLYNDANCLYKLGDMYNSGLFVPKNVIYGFKLYERAFHAIKNEEEDSAIGADIRFRIGKAVLHGEGINKDIPLAFDLLSHALSGFYARRKTDPFVGSLIEKTKALIIEAEEKMDQEII